MVRRTSVPHNAKSNTARISSCRCGRWMRGKLSLLPGEVSQTLSRPSERRSKACCEKSAEAIVPKFFFREGPNNRKSCVHTGRRTGALKAEYRKGCPQRDSVEHEEYAGARSTGSRESRERDGAKDLLERILNRDNLNKAYKQVKSNHGAPGIDGMTVEAALPWLRENRDELLQSIRDG